MEQPHKFEPLEYWKLKAEVMQTLLEQTELHARLAELLHQRTSLLKSVGIEESQRYRFNDSEFSLVVITDDK